MWSSRDAWVLQSVVYAGRRGDLSGIIANADFINVDIPSREQLEASVGRLEAAGLVNTESGHPRPTRSGTRLVRQRSRFRRSVRDLTPRIETALREHVAFPARAPAWSLREEDWRSAYEGYIGK